MLTKLEKKLQEIYNRDKLLFLCTTESLMSNLSNEESIEVEGEVIELLPNTKFRLIAKRHFVTGHTYLENENAFH